MHLDGVGVIFCISGFGSDERSRVGTPTALFRSSAVERDVAVPPLESMPVRDPLAVQMLVRTTARSGEVAMVKWPSVHGDDAVGLQAAGAEPWGCTQVPSRRLEAASVSGRHAAIPAGCRRSHRPSLPSDCPPITILTFPIGYACFKYASPLILQPKTIGGYRRRRRSQRLCVPCRMLCYLYGGDTDCVVRTDFPVNRLSSSRASRRSWDHPHYR